MRRVLRIGHRGATGHAPENTLAEIQTGISLGVDFVEVDVRSTADGSDSYIGESFSEGGS